MDGDLIPTSITDTLHDEAADMDHEFAEGVRTDLEDALHAHTESLMVAPASSGELGRGKCHKRANAHYFQNEFWEEA